MAERRLLFIRILLFLFMVLCFSLQSFDNFLKYLENKTSISESEIQKSEEALPSFSVCSEPSFDVQFMKQYNVSPNLFLGSYRLSFLSHNYQFPPDLSADINDGLTLQNYWTSSALSPFKVYVEETFSISIRARYSSIKFGKKLPFLCSIFNCLKDQSARY